MYKREIAGAAAVILIFAVILVSSGLLRSYANTIDNVHWQGTPLPPCFVNGGACGGHVLGTDEVGRDILARLIVGAPVSLGVSLAAVIFELVTAALLLWGAQRGGTALRLIIARCTDAASCLSAWPFIALVAVIAFEERPLVRLAVIALAAGGLFAARAMVITSERVSSRSRLRQAARDWAVILLMLATVDFFGFGVQPPTPSWGNMLVDLQTDMQIAWWAAIFPATSLFLAALIIELAGRTMGTDVLPIELRKRAVLAEGSGL